MYKYSIVIPWFLKIRCRRVDQSASYPVRDLTDRELVCRRVSEWVEFNAPPDTI